MEGKATKICEKATAKLMSGIGSNSNRSSRSNRRRSNQDQLQHHGQNQDNDGCVAVARSLGKMKSTGRKTLPSSLAVI